MGMEKLIIIGAGGHARVVLDVAIATRRFEPLGFVDDNRKAGLLIDGLPVLGNLERIPSFVAEHGPVSFVVAIGDNFARSQVVERIESISPEITWTVVIDPSAVISPRASIGKGAMIMPGVVINPAVSIGRHAIINNNTSLAHDNVFGDFSSTGPGVNTGGGVSVGAFSHVGVGAAVSHDITIGTNTVIGAGSVIIRHCPENAIVVGVPGRTVGTRISGARYL